MSIRLSSRRSRCRPRLASAKTTTPTSCKLNSYGFDDAGNRTSIITSIGIGTGTCTTSTTKTLTYNSASQLTNSGYVYDGLGRNTSIPAAHSPNSVGVIGLSYKVTDQVASITQSGVSTVYGFDAYGRRVTETTGGSVLTKHYTASSDNPAWSSNNAGVTDFYVNSLGTGLNGTVHVDNGVKTLSLDVNDLRGNTVTRINLDTATTDSWVSFDEYGNRDSASTGKVVTYDAYGQYERATTSQGLILMGARVYNPVTNQFTSPDPVTGGNETSYTYPNDPINKNDFTGLFGLSAAGIFWLGLLMDGFIWAFSASTKLINPVMGTCVSILLSLLANSILQAIDLTWGPKSRTKGSRYSYVDLLVAGIAGALSGFVAPSALNLVRSRLRSDFGNKSREFLLDKGISLVFETVIHAVWGKDKESNSTPTQTTGRTYIGPKY